MKRICPHCSAEMHVFDEPCAACGKPSRPGLLLAIATILHGYRSMILMIAVLVVSWVILTKVFGF
ncbi:MAG: hypothetical protein PHI06_13005 [Desulfobulbaceae bacterium]|nr:hypothetical protein [Desulfobulbaceae bacterium]